MWRLFALLLSIGVAWAEPSDLVGPVKDAEMKLYVQRIFSKSGATRIPCAQAIRDGGYPIKGDLPFQFSLTRYPPQGACAIFAGNPRWLIQNVFTTKSNLFVFYFDQPSNTFIRANRLRYPDGPSGTGYEIVKGVETRNGTLWYITIASQI